MNEQCISSKDNMDDGGIMNNLQRAKHKQERMNAWYSLCPLPYDKNLKSTGVQRRNGGRKVVGGGKVVGVERWLGWSPPSFIQIGSKLPKFVFGVVFGWVG